MDHERWHKLHCRAKAAESRLLEQGRDLDLMGRFWAWYDRQNSIPGVVATATEQAEFWAGDPYYALEPQIGE